MSTSETTSGLKVLFQKIITSQMENIFTKWSKLKKIESGAYHGQFVIDSLKSGQGITIGNQLRRVLLGELGCMAISAVRIAGVNHEFATIPGVREDILEILLNLKGVILKTQMQETLFGRMKIQGPAVVTADSIQLPSEIKIVNPNHYIATISTSNILEIEFKFEYGTGYKLASQIFSEDADNFLQLDAIFMPIQKVDFKIESVYDSTNYVRERVLIDIWTNGSVSPKKALESAVKIVIDLFTSLIDTNNSSKKQESETVFKSHTVEPYTNIAIEELQLSVRAYNCLKKAQINTVGDLLRYSPERLQKLKNFGKKSADEVFFTLKNKLGILFK